jgi:hypothetical protein
MSDTPNNNPNIAYIRGNAAGNLKIEQERASAERREQVVYEAKQRLWKRDREAEEAEERRQAAEDAAKTEAIEAERQELAAQMRAADKADARRRYDAAMGDPSDAAFENFWKVEEIRILQERMAQQATRVARPGRDY